jgi:hypothetical protein
VGQTVIGRIANDRHGAGTFRRAGVEPLTKHCTSGAEVTCRFEVSMFGEQLASRIAALEHLPPQLDLRTISAQ